MVRGGVLHRYGIGLRLLGYQCSRAKNVPFLAGPRTPQEVWQSTQIFSVRNTWFTSNSIFEHFSYYPTKKPMQH